MIAFVIKRLVYSVPMLLGITFLTFVFIQLAPGDFLSELKANPQISRQAIELYQKQFHLNEPLLNQYIIWLKNLFQGQLGYSFSYRAEVKDVILSRAANTLLLSSVTIIFTWIIVIPLGIIAAVKKGKLIDKFISFFCYWGISTPSFFLALIMLYLAYLTGWFPLGGMRSLNYQELSFWGRFLDISRHLALPVIVLSFGSIASLQRIMRANMIEVLEAPYIKAAEARGISKIRILYVHALKNALNPMITIFGYQFSSLLSGAALTEIVIGWPGLGQVTLEAVRKQDIYLVMGSVVIGGVLLILGNLIADILLGFFDPRIRYQKGR